VADFAGENIREYFSADFGDLYRVVYTPASSFAITTDIFIETKTAESEDGTTRISFSQIIVGKDHVPSPAGGDEVYCEAKDRTYYVQEVLEEDNDTARLRCE
jgi:hypothetical protein